MEDYSNALFDKHTLLARPLILIADDDEDNLLLMGYILDFLQFRYISTNNSQKLWRLAKEYLPNLILLDIIMPEINGIDLAYQLKHNQTTAEIPLIAITGLVQGEYQDKIQQAGFSNYLSKPFLMTDLEAILKSYLN